MFLQPIHTHSYMYIHTWRGLGGAMVLLFHIFTSFLGSGATAQSAPPIVNGAEYAIITSWSSYALLSPFFQSKSAIVSLPLANRLISPIRGAPPPPSTAAPDRRPFSSALSSTALPAEYTYKLLKAEKQLLQDLIAHQHEPILSCRIVSIRYRYDITFIPMTQLKTFFFFLN